MKKKIMIAITIIIVLIGIINNLKIKEKPNQDKTQNLQQEEHKTINDIEIVDIDGKQINYSFEYRNETYNAIYTVDNWQIINSYKITNQNDITVICENLIEIHKIHGSDMISYRTAKDMAYEWLQHNIAYAILPESNSFKQSAKDVDLDPRDQNKSLKEMYEDRTGKEFKIEDFLK